MSLVPVTEARERLLHGVVPLGAETVPIGDALGRVLAADVAARLTQPPFPASAMDGYAVRAAEATEGAELRVVGASRAGERFSGTLGPREAVRIFTGAPIPDGADAVLIQENTEAREGTIRVLASARERQHIRPRGLDFNEGDVLLRRGRVIDARAIAVAAAMNHALLPVRRRPRVAILANGDELVPAGGQLTADQIVSSNGPALVAFVRECGGEPVDLGIAPDDREAIATFVDRAGDTDVLVVAGGASVGEHDLVRDALSSRGMVLDFWKIAMRPGKPLMVGTLKRMRVLGLPGNPVSVMVCGRVFLRPLIRAFLGLPAESEVLTARLGAPMPANDTREDYVRARLNGSGVDRVATPFPVQDSSMLGTLAAADALIIRPIGAPPAAAGETVPILLLPPS
jgi:molybdopterin molybdotransferase